MRNILITGGTGFIGKHIVDRLLNSGGYKIYMITRSGIASFDNVINIKGDLKEPGTYKKIDAEIDICIHAAGYITAANRIEEDEKCIDENIIATLQLVKYLTASSPNVHIIHLSTCSVYNMTVDADIYETYANIVDDSYGLSKYYSEQLVLRHNHASSILRLSAILDDGEESIKYQQLFFEWVHKAQNNNEIIIFGDGSSVRNYLFIDDLVDAIITVLEKKCYGVFNIVGKENITTTDLANRIINASNSSAEIVYDKERLVINNKGRVIADKILEVSAWHPKYDIDKIIETVINRNNEG